MTTGNRQTMRKTEMIKPARGRPHSLQPLVRKVTLALILLLTALSPHIVLADVRLPHGEYFLNVDDLSVKVLGGHVTAKRTWYQAPGRSTVPGSPSNWNRTPTAERSKRSSATVTAMNKKTAATPTASAAATASKKQRAACAGRTAGATGSTTTPRAASAPTVIATTSKSASSSTPKGGAVAYSVPSETPSSATNTTPKGGCALSATAPPTPSNTATTAPNSAK